MKPLRIVTIVLGLLLVALLVVFFWPEKTSQPPSIPEQEQPPAVAPDGESEILYPLPEAPTPLAGEEAPAIPPLPALGESDAFISELLIQLFGEPAWKQLLAPQHFIRRLVLIIDALPRKDLPVQHLPVRSPPGSFQTAGKPGAEVIDTVNFGRYAAYVRLAEAVPPQRLAEAYLRIYPLLEQAYRELDHPEDHFHDRMIEVLDHLLATPQVRGPIPVAEHNNRYRYADPKLESLSAGQKILLRMGPENARRIKNVLQQLRNLLVGIPGKTGTKK
jgi:hypothetical protein